MYNCTFETTDGNTFQFGYEYGTLFDLDPISELDVDISTSQGFQQIGTTIEAETVGGVSREIKGVFLDYTNTTLAYEMLTVFTPGTHGKLYFNDTLYCDCAVQKTPAISLVNRKRSFSLMLYCAYPYWVDSEETSYSIGGYTKSFSFPVCYDEHSFGEVNGDLYISCENSGMVEIPYKVVFTSATVAEGYGIENVGTGDMIKLNDTLVSGETVTIYREEGKLKIEKEADGETEDIFSTLDEDSTFFSIPVGTSTLAKFADSGSSGLSVELYIQPAYTGVVVDE